MHDLQDYPETKEISNDFKEIYKAWYANPRHWTNNRRRMHGLAVLRKTSNNKNRFEPPRSMLVPYTNKIETLISKIQQASILDFIDQMADIKDIQIGQKASFIENLERIKYGY